MIGKINNVSWLAVMSPPITTIARGREVSEPIPVEVAAGRRPMAARVAVIKTGRIRETTERIAWSRCILSCRFFIIFESKITLFWMYSFYRQIIDLYSKQQHKNNSIVCFDEVRSPGWIKW